MPILAAPEDVIRRADVRSHPEYEDISPMSNCAGFFAYRRYPAETELAQLVSNDGRPAVRCYLRFVVGKPAQGSHISRVELQAWLGRRWQPSRVLYGGEDPSQPGHPDAPTSHSATILNRTQRPIDLDETDFEGFIYDNQEDVFLDEDGRKVTAVQILEWIYAKHCRTLRLGFRIRWKIGSWARRAIREAVWKSQDAAMWALLTCYDVEVVGDKLTKRVDFFYKYKVSDFRRITDQEGERSHFFGFQSSQKSFFTNLVAVVVVCLLLYWKGPREGLLRTIYNNTALSTAALIFAFLLADTFGPWLLIRLICVLSRFRDAVLFFIRKVKV